MNIIIMRKKLQSENEIQLRIKDNIIFEIVETHNEDIVRIITRTLNEELARKIYSSIKER